MPLSFVIDRELELVVTRSTGRISQADLQRHAQALLQAGDRPSRELADFTGRDEIQVPMNSVRSLAEQLRSDDVEAAGGQLAMVADHPAVYGLLRVYRGHRNDDATAVEVFATLEEALAWLDVDIDAFLRRHGRRD